MAKETRGNPRPKVKGQFEIPGVKHSPKRLGGRLTPQQKGKLVKQAHRYLIRRDV